MPLTLEQRRQGGLRSAEIQRKAAAELAMLRDLLTSKLTSPDTKLQIYSQAVPAPVQPELSPLQSLELARTRERLDKLDKLMAEAKDGEEWDQYSRSYERIFKAWVHLAGIPGPGQYKPYRDTPRRRDLPRLAPEPQPIVSHSSGVQSGVQLYNPTPEPLHGNDLPKP